MTNESPMRRITANAMVGVHALSGLTRAHGQDAAALAQAVVQTGAAPLAVLKQIVDPLLQGVR